MWARSRATALGSWVAKRTESHAGATVSSTKQMEAWYMKRASKKTQLVSKLAVDFSNRMSELQVGCLYTFKSGKMYMTLTSSGHLQSFIVGDGRGGDL